MEASMSNSFLNWTNRVAVAGRVTEHKRRATCDELTISGDYHLPFGKTEAQTKATRWLWQVYLI